MRAAVLARDYVGLARTTNRCEKVTFIGRICSRHNRSRQKYIFADVVSCTSSRFGPYSGRSSRSKVDIERRVGVDERRDVAHLAGVHLEHGVALVVLHLHDVVHRLNTGFLTPCDNLWMCLVRNDESRIALV